jgi:hypothetical protein
MCCRCLQQVSRVSFHHGPDHVNSKKWNALLSQVYSCNLVVENGSGSQVTARFLSFITII